MGKKVKALLVEHLDEAARGKAAYKKAGDALTAALDAGAPIGEPIKLPGGRVVVLRDQYEEKHEQFKATRFSRYKVEDVKTE